MPDSLDFSARLAQLFQELGGRWQERAPEEMVITDERVRQELALPIGTQTRICYFSLPAALVSFYKEAVFPLADRTGLVPAAGDELFGRAGTLRTLLDLLLSRAIFVVGDISEADPRVTSELRAARQRLTSMGVAVVTDMPPVTSVESPVDADETVIYRPPLSAMSQIVPADTAPTGLPVAGSEWLGRLESSLKAASYTAMNDLIREARRMLQTDSRNAVVAASSALDIALQRRLHEIRLGSGKRRRASASAAPRLPAVSRLADALERAGDLGVVYARDMVPLRTLVRLRDLAIHGAESDTSKRQFESVEAIDSVTKSLQVVQQLQSPHP